jgi:hypothetical protein
VGVAEGEELEDPERVVLFDDLRDYLFQFTCEDLKRELAFRFIEFLGVACLPPRASSNDSYRQQKILNMEEIGDIFEIIISKKANWTSERTVTEPTLVEFIRSLFAQLSKFYPSDTTYNIAYMSFEQTYNINSARQLARTLLKSNQHDLLLWNQYAQLEKKAGKKDEARRVYSTALSMHYQLPPKFQADAPFLFRSYAEMELEEGNTTSAIHILASVVEGAFNPPTPKTEVPPTRIIKARKTYQQQLPTKAASSKNLHFVICYALFEYLTVGLKAACQVFDGELKNYRQGDMLYEELCVAYAGIVYMHSSKNPTPPGVLRNLLMSSMNIYPTNTYFLSLFIEWETRSQIANRLRNYFDDICER